MKGKIIIVFFVAIFLSSLLPFDIIDTVVATSITTEIDFELPHGVKNTQFNDGFLKTTRSNYGGTKDFNVTDVNPRSGVLDFHVSAPSLFTTCYTLGWWNFTYSKSQYMTNIKIGFGHVTAVSPGYYQYMVFYNRTTQGNLISSNPPVLVNAQLYAMAYFCIASSGANYFIQTKTGQQKINQSQHEFIEIDITNDNGYQVDYYTNYLGTRIAMGSEHTPYNSTSFINGCRIDSCIIFSGVPGATGCSVYYDDLNFTLSTSYDVGGGGSGSCISTTGLDYYSKNIEVMDGYIDIATPYIEFTSHSALSITPEVFEFWVGSALYEGDSDTSNYFLYINGLTVGNPECFYLLSGETYVIQWDLSTFSPISEEVLIFEIAHTITFDGTYYWNIAKSTPSYIYGPPSPTMITYRNTGTNGVLDGSPYYYGSCWKLYYSAFGTPEEEENTDFNVGLSLIGFNTHSVYNVPYSYIYDTVFFEVFSNRTDNYYHINISKGSSPMGNEQNYPKDIYSYHVIHGFTPTSQGNYTVSLCKDSTNAIVDHKHFNVTTKTVDYAIWTFPNPSNTGTNHGVGVYISDDSTFLNFYVSGVADIDNVNNYTLATRKIKVGTLDSNKYWSTSLVTFAYGGWEYWRLWGTNDNVSFIPLTSVYQHYVNSLTTNNYIRTSLTNGEGYAGESFNVYGQHGYILSQLQVYLDNKPIKDVSTNVSFLIPYSFSSVGTHTFSLRILNDGEWETVDSVVVSIVFKPSGDGELSGLLPPPYSYIMGAIITIALMILPSIGLGKIGMAQSESLKYVPIFSGTMGFILSCLIGFFPWYSIFALVFILIMIIVVLYLAKKKE